MKVCESEKIKIVIKEGLKDNHDFLAEQICNMIDKYTFEIRFKEKAREE